MKLSSFIVISFVFGFVFSQTHEGRWMSFFNDQSACGGTPFLIELDEDNLNGCHASTSINIEKRCSVETNSLIQTSYQKSDLDCSGQPYGSSEQKNNMCFSKTNGSETLYQYSYQCTTPTEVSAYNFIKVFDGEDCDDDNIRKEIFFIPKQYDYCFNLNETTSFKIAENGNSIQKVSFHTSDCTGSFFSANLNVGGCIRQSGNSMKLISISKGFTKSISVLLIISLLIVLI